MDTLSILFVLFHFSFWLILLRRILIILIRIRTIPSPVEFRFTYQTSRHIPIFSEWIRISHATHISSSLIPIGTAASPTPKTTITTSIHNRHFIFRFIFTIKHWFILYIQIYRTVRFS